MKQLIKHIFIATPFALVAISCDLRTNTIEDLNQPPYFSFQEQVVTSLVDSMKSTRGDYFFPVEIRDPNGNLTLLQFENIQGAGQFLVDLVPVENEVSVKSDNPDLRFGPSFDGKHVLQITAVDAFGQKAQLTVDLTAFDNIGPVAMFEIVDPPNTGPFERLIDASKSSDRDENFGGGIDQYEYTFLGIVVPSNDDTQTVIFPSTGTYQVIVRVQDNDGIWSDPVAMNETI